MALNPAGPGRAAPPAPRGSPSLAVSSAWSRAGSRVSSGQRGETLCGASGRRAAREPRASTRAARRRARPVPRLPFAARTRGSGALTATLPHPPAGASVLALRRPLTHPLPVAQPLCPGSGRRRARLRSPGSARGGARGRPTGTFGSPATPRRRGRGRRASAGGPEGGRSRGSRGPRRGPGFVPSLGTSPAGLQGAGRRRPQLAPEENR